MKIWHNPRCSKSRQCLAWLEEEGCEVEVFKYLETPPSRKEIEAVINALGITPREMMRVKEAEYKEMGLKDADDQTLIDAMVKVPKLIERPIVIKEGKAAIGRPLEKVMELVKG